jgi:hypothetical protein
MQFKKKNWEMHFILVVDFHIQFTTHETPKIHPNPLALHCINWNLLHHIIFTILFIYCWIILFFIYHFVNESKKIDIKYIGYGCKDDNVNYLHNDLHTHATKSCLSLFPPYYFCSWTSTFICNILTLITF